MLSWRNKLKYYVPDLWIWETYTENFFTVCISDYFLLVERYTASFFLSLLNSQLVSTLSVVTYHNRRDSSSAFRKLKSPVLIKPQRKPAAISRTDHLAYNQQALIKTALNVLKMKIHWNHCIIIGYKRVRSQMQFLEAARKKSCTESSRLTGN